MATTGTYSAEQDAVIREMWLAGATLRDIGAAVGHAAGGVSSRAIYALGLPKRERGTCHRRGTKRIAPAVAETLVDAPGVRRARGETGRELVPRASPPRLSAARGAQGGGAAAQRRGARLDARRAADDPEGVGVVMGYLADRRAREARNAAILAAVMGGRSCRDVGAEFGVGKSTVATISALLRVEGGRQARVIDRAGIGRAWSDGVKAEAIAAEYGVALGTVRRIVRGLGLPPRPTGSPRRIDRAPIVAALEAGDKLEAIAAAHGISLWMVGAIRREAGLPPRKRGGARRRSGGGGDVSPV